MSTNDWWSKKLTNQPAQRQPLPPTSPAPYQPLPPQQQQPNVQVSYDPNTDQTVTKAVSARRDDRCPGCGSGNYFAPAGTQRMRCYDCGYPVVQSATGGGMPSGSGGSGNVERAKQVTSSGFNPNVIVDRLG